MVVEGGRGQDRNCQGGKLSFRAVFVGVRTWPEFSSATNFDFTYSYFSQDKNTSPVNQYFQMSLWMWTSRIDQKTYSSHQVLPVGVDHVSIFALELFSRVNCIFSEQIQLWSWDDSKGRVWISREAPTLLTFQQINPFHHYHMTTTTKLIHRYIDVQLRYDRFEGTMTT